MLSCIVGALLACGQSATIVIAGPVPYAPQQGGVWQYYAQPIQFVPPLIIVRHV